MARYTKKDADGRYYIESVNGKLESDKFGHTYGEAIDRFAELENADVAPRAEVAREIFEEIERIFDQHTEGGYYLNGVWFHKRLDLDTREAIAELKKKYAEGEK